jgi:hypothetical protein
MKEEDKGFQGKSQRKGRYRQGRRSHESLCLMLRSDSSGESIASFSTFLM